MNATLINSLTRYSTASADDYAAHIRATRAALVPAEWMAAARRECDAPSNCRVIVRPGAAAPELRGRSYHWTTPGGDPVRYPSAYSRAFGRPVYHRSTHRVVVGADWRPSTSRRDIEVVP